MTTREMKALTKYHAATNQALADLPPDSKWREPIVQIDAALATSLPLRVASRRPRRRTTH